MKPDYAKLVAFAKAEGLEPDPHHVAKMQSAELQAVRAKRMWQTLRVICLVCLMFALVGWGLSEFISWLGEPGPPEARIVLPSWIWIGPANEFIVPNGWARPAGRIVCQGGEIEEGDGNKDIIHRFGSYREEFRCEHMRHFSHTPEQVYEP